MTQAVTLQQIKELLDQSLGALESRINQRLDGMGQRFDGIDQRFDKMDQRLDKMDQRFDGMDQRLDKMDQRFDKMDGRMDGQDSRFDILEKKMDYGFHTVHQRIDGLHVDLDDFKESSTENQLLILDRLETIENENHMRDRDIRRLKEKVKL